MTSDDCMFSVLPLPSRTTCSRVGMSEPGLLGCESTWFGTASGIRLIAEEEQVQRRGTMVTILCIWYSNYMQLYLHPCIACILLQYALAINMLSRMFAKWVFILPEPSCLNSLCFSFPGDWGSYFGCSKWASQFKGLLQIDALHATECKDLSI